MANKYQRYSETSKRISSNDLNQRGEDLTSLVNGTVDVFGGSSEYSGGGTTITIPDNSKSAYDFEVTVGEANKIYIRPGRWLLNGNYLTDNINTTFPTSSVTVLTLPPVPSGEDEATVSIMAALSGTIETPKGYTLTALSGDRIPFSDSPDLWIADVSYNVNGRVHKVEQVQEGPKQENLLESVNFKVTVYEDSSGDPRARVDGGYVTNHDIYFSGNPASAGLFPATNPKIWSVGTKTPAESLVGPSYPTNPEYVNGSSTGYTSIEFGEGFDTGSSSTDVLTITTNKTAQIYLAVVSLGPKPNDEYYPWGEETVYMEFVADQDVTEYRSAETWAIGSYPGSGTIPTPPGTAEGQVTVKYTLIANIVALADGTYDVNQVQTDPIDCSATRTSVQPASGSGMISGSAIGDMLVWGTPVVDVWNLFPISEPGQTLFTSPVDGLQEWRFGEYVAHAKVNTDDTIIIEGGSIAAPYTYADDLNYQTTPKTEFGSLDSTNFFYVEVHATATPTGWKMIEDGITGAESSYPAVTRYETVQEDYIPASAPDGSKVFRFPIALVGAAAGTITSVTQLQEGQIEFNKDSTASAIRYIIYFADDSTTPLVTDMDDILTGYNPATMTDWSLQLTVASGVITTFASPKGNVNTDLYNGDASTSTAQTFCRVPIIRDGLPVSMAGSYRENIVCKGSKGPIVELIKIG